jgi:hypothetical protein
MAASTVAKVGKDAFLWGSLGGVRGVGELQHAPALVGQELPVGRRHRTDLARCE